MDICLRQADRIFEGQAAPLRGFSDPAPRQILITRRPIGRNLFPTGLKSARTSLPRRRSSTWQLHRTKGLAGLPLRPGHWSWQRTEQVPPAWFSTGSTMLLPNCRTPLECRFTEATGSPSPRLKTSHAMAAVYGLSSGMGRRFLSAVNIQSRSRHASGSLKRTQKGRSIDRPFVFTS